MSPGRAGLTLARLLDDLREQCVEIECWRRRAGGLVAEAIELRLYHRAVSRLDFGTTDVIAHEPRGIALGALACEDLGETKHGVELEPDRARAPRAADRIAQQ